MARKPKIKPRNPMARSLWDGSCRKRVVLSKRDKQQKRRKGELRRELMGNV